MSRDKNKFCISNFSVLALNSCTTALIWEPVLQTMSQQINPGAALIMYNTYRFKMNKQPVCVCVFVNKMPYCISNFELRAVHSQWFIFMAPVQECVPGTVEWQRTWHFSTFNIQSPSAAASSQQPAAFPAWCSEAAAVATVAVAVAVVFFSSRRYLSFKEYIEK